jgi:hypothetical protein
MRPVTLNPNYPLAALREIQTASHENDIVELSQAFTINGAFTPTRVLNAALSLLTASATTTVNFKVGNFSRDLSLGAGNQSITGVGFQPSVILFFAGLNATSGISWGFADATSKGCIYGANTIVAGGFGVHNGAPIIFLPTATIDYQGQVASLDPDGFTISWGTFGSTPSGTALVNYLAMGSTSTAPTTDSTLAAVLATLISDMQKGGQNRTT